MRSTDISTPARTEKVEKVIIEEKLIPAVPKIALELDADEAAFLYSIVSNRSFVMNCGPHNTRKSEKNGVASDNLWAALNGFLRDHALLVTTDGSEFFKAEKTRFHALRLQNLDNI
jgi:TPP-dependent 2-oxoacid decarboxylase